MFLEGKCEVAVVEREVFTKVCSWKHLDGRHFSSKRDTGKDDVAFYFAACEERLVQV